MLKEAKKALPRLAILFLFVWLGAVFLFIRSILPSSTSGGEYLVRPRFFFFLGVGAFLLMITSAILGADSKPKERKVGLEKKSKKLPSSRQSKLSYYFAGSVVILMIVVGFLTQRVVSLEKAKVNNYETIKETSSPTPTATPVVKGTTKTKTQPIIDDDPIIDCNFTYLGTIRLRRSVCSKSTDCWIGGKWVYYDSVDKCKEDQKASQHVQQVQQPTTQPSSNLSYHCYDNTYDYWYYTSSGDKCNEDNLQSSSYKICTDTQESKRKACNSICEGELENDRAACAWAYTSPNAGIEQNSDLYGECLNDPEDSASAHYSICLEKCTNQYAEDLKQCS